MWLETVVPTAFLSDLAGPDHVCDCTGSTRRNLKQLMLPGLPLREANSGCVGCLQRALVILRDSHSEHCPKVSSGGRAGKSPLFPAFCPLLPGGQDSEHGGRVQGDIVTWRPSPISALPTPNLFLTLATCPSACTEPASRLSLTHHTCPGPTQMAMFQVTRNGLLWPRAVPRRPATRTEPCLCHLAPLSLSLPIWR